MENHQKSVTRRAAVGAIGAGISGGLAGCLGSATRDDEFDRQMDAVREATERYTDHAVALEDGFVVLGPIVPGMGWHFAHPERLEAAASEGPSLEEPPLLTYDRDLNLGSVEWGVPADAVEDTPDLFADEGADTTESWHTEEAATQVLAVPDGDRTPPGEIVPEDVLTNDNWAMFRPPDPALAPGEAIELHWGSLRAKEETPKEERIVDIVESIPDLLTLHAWVHEDNPEGVFHPVNPEFSDGDAHHDHEH